MHIIDLDDHSITACLKLDSCLHHLLCNGEVLVAVHELGASVIQLSTFQEIANVYSEVVADASLTDDELVLVSMDEEITRVDLAAAH